MTSSLLSLIALSPLLQSPPSIEAAVDRALAPAGLSTKTARFDEGLLRFFRHGEFTSPLYSALSENPWRAPFVMEVKRKELADLGGRPSDSLTSLGGFAGWGTRRMLVKDPLSDAAAAAAKPSGLTDVLQRLRREGIVTGRVPSLGAVPPPVRQATALILNVGLKAKDFRRAAFRDVPAPGTLFARFAKGIPDEDSVNFVSTLDTYRRVDTRLLMAGAHDMLRATQLAAAMVKGVDPAARYNVRIPTSWGVIRLSGGGNTVHPTEPNLLTIDTGGSDTYINGGSNASSANWCSVVIDTAGNDRHVSDVRLIGTPIDRFTARQTGNLPGPAGAVMGYAFVFDLVGKDLYRSHRPGLGAARLGAGVLIDQEGDDVYDAYADSQGCGLFGAGILEDQAGDDAYSGFNQVQGVGLTMGAGYLVDRAGDDQYTANDTRIDFPSAQSGQHNVSMSQGAGNGRRADYLEGHSLAGGVGILFDQAGTDAYSCGVFGQGVGYWQGVGALWDTGGSDRYAGQWYTQGASAHFAVGYLEDEDGADQYVTAMNMGNGAGHDFGVGILIDRRGDDRYKSPNLSLGAGNACGIGWLLDLEGDDRYDSTGITLGRASESPSDSLRSRGLCLGLFMDTAGTDTYPTTAPWATDGRPATSYASKRAQATESQLGVFWDE
jgi:hypothetical protein